LIDAIFRFLARLVWMGLTEWIGYWTGRAAIQALSLGRIDVADLGFLNQKSLRPFWYQGRQPVISSWAACVFGQVLWAVAFVGTMIILTQF
jgi:hypothetical protein